MQDTALTSFTAVRGDQAPTAKGGSETATATKWQTDPETHLQFDGKETADQNHKLRHSEPIQFVVTAHRRPSSNSKPRSPQQSDDASALERQHALPATRARQSHQNASNAAAGARKQKAYQQLRLDEPVHAPTRKTQEVLLQ
jgi:hypothetical protein